MTQTQDMEVWGDVTVGSDGPFQMDSSVGLCRDPQPVFLERQLINLRRSFICNEATFGFEPAPNSIRGTVSVEVYDNLRTLGPKQA